MLISDVLRQLSGVVQLASTIEERAVTSCRLIVPDEVGEHFEVGPHEIVVIADPRPSRQVVDRVLRAKPGLVIFKSSQPAVWPPGPWALVEPSVPWDRLLRILDQILIAATRDEVEKRVARRREMDDLYALALDLAERVPGLVTIDDAASNLLAFSPLDETADDLRRASVFGRGAPSGHVDELARSGLWRRLTREQTVLHVPKSPLRHERLVVGIFDESQKVWIGTVWVQRGRQPFSESAKEELMAGALIAARMMSHSQRRSAERRADARALLGLTDTAHQASLVRQRPPDRPCRLAAFTTRGSGLWSNLELIALELRAMRLSRGSQVVDNGDTVYVFLPEAGSEEHLGTWANEVAQSLEATLGTRVYAAVGATSLGRVESIRSDVDDLLALVCVPRGITGLCLGGARASLESARALYKAAAGDGLGQQLAAQLELVGAGRAGELLESVRLYFEGAGDVASAAARLHIHPNTLRQRVRRVEALAGLSLSNADERFYLEMQVRALTLVP